MQGRRGRAVPLRAVLHRVAADLEVDPPGAGCLLEDVEILPPGLLRVRLIAGHIRLIVHGLDGVAILEILLSGTAIEHPFDNLC